MPSFRDSFAALRHRNYRLWFGGQMVSLFGTWMQGTAQGYLIFDLTKSPAQLGLVAFAAGAPTWIFMLYAGVVADRRPKRAVLVTAQTTMMISAFVLSVLTFAHIVQPWHIWCLAFMTGIGNAFDAPARQAIVPQLVNKDELTNAIAMNSLMFNMAAIVGPALAGLTYAAWGPGWCFFLNGVSFLAVIGALLAMRGLVDVVKKQRHAWIELKEGFAYIAQQPLIKTLIAFIGMMSLVGISFATLFPAWAVNILHGDSRTVGYLQSGRGAGAFLGALAVVAMGKVQYRGRRLMAVAIVFPLALWLFSMTTSLVLALAALILVGGSSMIMMNLAMAMMQTTIEDKLRGRVMAVYTLMFFGMMPLGGLLVGGLAEWLGERMSIVVNAGVFTAAVLTLFVMNRRILRQA